MKTTRRNYDVKDLSTGHVYHNEVSFISRNDANYYNIIRAKAQSKFKDQFVSIDHVSNLIVVESI